MPIREMELMHGAVLAKLCRNDNPVTLRVYGSCSGDDKVVVARNRVDTWVVPGS